ncbi:MAG: phosphoglycerate kinase [Akkermansiaceae bacterium]|nr:phosphoglycerate kinase [Akkermansiaceae bacterium]
MAKLTIRDLDVTGKQVFMRADFNVPLKNGVITNDARITAALPTINYLLDHGARLVLSSHLGRPANAPDPAYSLAPVAVRLGELLGKPVTFVPEAIGEQAAAARTAMKDGDVLLLENVRFYPGEKKNDPDFAKALLGEATLYVNDAFGTAHRAHASTEGVTHFAEKSAMGLLVERELEYLEGRLENPEHPFVVIMGGAKVSDKIEVLSKLMEKADTFLIGGAMANTFLAAQGYGLGASKIESDKLDLAREILADAQAHHVRFLLPADVRVAMKFEEGAPTVCTKPFAEGGRVPEGGMAIDIGDKAIEEFSQIVKSAKTVLWNGPMGVFEIDSFAKGTKEIAEALAASDAVSIVGGGDSVTAARKFNVQDQLSFCSTGGGASLELLEGKVLPGVGALTEK